jgi:hypothetical protein
MFAFYELLLTVLSSYDSQKINDIEVPVSTRYAGAIIICRLLSDKYLYGVHDAIMKEGVLTYVAKSLRDK